jgi:RND family efflux transporter MFP subunit
MIASHFTRGPRKARWLAIAALALALALAACGGSASEQARTPETVAGVRVVTVSTQSVPDEIEAPGTVRSATTAEIAARAMGTVQAVLVREGDAVRRSQLLVQIDDRELAARSNAAQSALDEAAAARDEVARGVAAAQAQADVAKKTYDRFAYLREQKSVSPQEFDEVEAKYRAATAGLEQAQARQQQVEAMNQRAQSEARAASTVAGYTRVTSPLDGIVVRRHVDPGAMAMPGMPLLVVEETSRYRLEATVDAASAAALRRGAKARVELDALPGRSFDASVSELEAGADPGSQTVAVKVDLPRDAAIRSGLFGRAWFARGERQALLIPRGNLVERGQLTGVYVVDAQGIARLRIVTLGRSFGEVVEILSGLSDGDRIVTDPAGRELDGKQVQP